ncbi:MAG: S8 family serine peptidase [Gilvibacter sp.]
MEITTLPSWHRKISLLILSFFLMATTMVAQSDYTINYQGQLVNIPANIDTFSWDQMPESSAWADGYFGWLQFEQSPNQVTQDYFKDNKLELIEYLGKGAYQFFMAGDTNISLLRNYGVRGITSVQGTFKLQDQLEYLEIPDYAQSGDNILVTLQFYKNVDVAFVISDLATKQIAVAQQYQGADIIDLIIPDNCLEALSNLPYVRWVELVPAPPVKEDTQGKSLHRSNGLDTQTGSGWNYTGDGIGVIVRDDGVVGPHIDFQGRINNIPSGASGTHGDGVAGILSGAGNLNPRYRGMAAGSTMHVVNYVSNFLDSATTTLINSGDAYITNSSYGDGCNAGYTSNSRNVDLQTNALPSVLHVFSCGNSGGSNCGYGAGSGWGNITGGHKQGKNVIATANVFFDGSDVGSSSHGPAYDGRIKPDITAHGQGHISTGANNAYVSFGGTSGASPGIAGVSAQLYELYADTHGGTIPQSALVKAALLNTANDIGNVGPDFQHGWGLVNGLRAGNLLAEDRFSSDNISTGETNSITIDVPAGTSQARFMLYWNDPAASSGASTALVNDLDLVVSDPSSASFLPWLLDHTPDPVALNTPAGNGADHLNNMEQVLFNDPAAGTYTIDVSGFDVPFGPQEYFIVYELISEQLTMVYPNFGESLVPGETEVIHWDAVNTTDSFTLEYTTDDGGSWNAITTVSATTTNYSWTVPTEITGEARVRITSGAFSDESDMNFSIANLTSGIEILQVCETSVNLTWDEVAGAESYDIYVLGEKYMEVVGNATTNVTSVPIVSASNPVWVAVAARNDTEGWVARRTIAVESPEDGVYNCEFANDLAVESVNNTSADFALVCDASPVIISATIFNPSMNAHSGFQVSYQLDSDTPVSETYAGTIEPGFFADYDFTTPLSIPATGNYTLTVTVTLAADEDTSNDSETLDFYAALDATPLNAFEDFQTTGFPSEGWYIQNPDDDITWQSNGFIIGSAGESTRVGLVNNYSYEEIGEEDAFVTEVFDLTGAAVPGLVFDLAKAQRNPTFVDALRVEISTDCGDTYTTIYDKTGLELSTLSGYRALAWVPSSGDDWRQEEIDLSAYIGDQVQFRFVNVTGNGNYTYLDNVNVLNDYLGVTDQALNQLVMYPNPAQDAVTVALNQSGFEQVDLKVTNSLGQQVIVRSNITPNGNNAISFDVSGLQSGIYFVTVQVDGASSTKKLSIR